MRGAVTMDSNVIKELRKRTGLSQMSFAKKFNIPKRTIESWESGERKPPVYVIDFLSALINDGTEDEVMVLTINYKKGLSLKNNVNYLHFEKGLLCFTIDKKVHGVGADVVKIDLNCIESFDLEKRCV